MSTLLFVFSYIKSPILDMAFFISSVPATPKAACDPASRLMFTCIGSLGA